MWKETVLAVSVCVVADVPLYTNERTGVFERFSLRSYRHCGVVVSCDFESGCHVGRVNTFISSL